MKKVIKPLIWIVIIGSIGAGGYYYLKSRKAQEEATVYRTTPVERRDITLSVSAVGVLEPLTTVEVKANVAGEVVDLSVDRGDYVHQGDLIASIDPTETRTAYEQAEADVTGAMARVKETLGELRRQKRVTPAQIAAAEDAVDAADARVSEAESALAYQERSTAASITRAEQSLRAAQARLAQSKALAEAQPTLTESSISQAEAGVRAARQALSRLSEATHPQERTTAESALQAAVISLENEKKALDRLQGLLKEGFVAKQEVEDRERAVADAVDRRDAAQATVDALERKQATELEEAKAEVSQAEAALTAAKTGKVDVDVAQRELEASEASLAEAQADLESARAGKEQDEQRRRELESAKIAAKEVRSQLEVTRASEIQPEISAEQVVQARADASRSSSQLENAAKNLSYTTIIAPRDGLVLDRFVEAGTVLTSARSSVTAGTSVVMLADVSRMFVLAEVDEADIGQIQLDQPVEIEIETFRDQTFSGTVTQIYPKGEEVENVTIFYVRIEVLDGLDVLKPGMTAEVEIVLDRVENALAVPNEAVFQQRGETLAEILPDPEGEPQQVPVEIGLQSFEWTEVKSGLTEGQEVVTGTGGFGMPGGNGKTGGQEQMRRMMKSVGKK